MLMNDTCHVEVSIILPVRNHIAFIEERIETIVSQTFQNWHCIVVDGYSTDGTWELIREKIDSDQRFTLYQREPKGVYDAWNFGIEKATGKYVYIATSDDTMYTNCIEVFYNTIEKFPDCGMAHCKLDIIDGVGNLIIPNPWEKCLSQVYFGDRINQLLVRKAPEDGFLHAYLFTIYTSITQLFIRRELFKTVGLFSLKHGITGDFEWGMRASLLTNVVQVPLNLATWRIHKDQLTQLDKNEGNRDYLHDASMVKSAVLAANVVRRRNKMKEFSFSLTLFYRSREIYSICSTKNFRLDRVLVLIKYLFIDPQALLFYLKYRGIDPIEIAKKNIDNYSE